MKAYMYDPEQEYKFKEEVECQRDPKESERVPTDSRHNARSGHDDCRRVAEYYVRN